MPVSPRECHEGSSEESVKLALGLLLGDPGHRLRLPLGETGLHVVGGSVADEEVVQVVHLYNMILYRINSAEATGGMKYVIVMGMAVGGWRNESLLDRKSIHQATVHLYLSRLARKSCSMACRIVNLLDGCFFRQPAMNSLAYSERPGLLAK